MVSGIWSSYAVHCDVSLFPARSPIQWCFFYSVWVRLVWMLRSTFPWKEQLLRKHIPWIQRTNSRSVGTHFFYGNTRIDRYCRHRHTLAYLALPPLHTAESLGFDPGSTGLTLLLPPHPAAIWVHLCIRDFILRTRAQTCASYVPVVSR